MFLSEKQINDYQTDGVIIVKDIFKDWVEPLKKGFQKVLDNPSKHGRENVSDNNGRFFEDYCNWERIEEFKDCIFNSPGAQIVTEATNSKSAQIFHEHVFIKEPGTNKETPWHQDMPYYCVSGDQTVSFWLPLESREQSVSLKCLAGSHSFPKEIRPTSWSNNDSFYEDNEAFMDLPNIDNGDFEIKQWATEPGDVVAFNFKLIHGANANIVDGLSRTLSFRLLGDDVVYRQRLGRTSPNFSEINQKNGERLREDWFPTIWSN